MFVIDRKSLIYHALLGCVLFMHPMVRSSRQGITAVVLPNRPAESELTWTQVALLLQVTAAASGVWAGQQGGPAAFVLQQPSSAGL